MDLKALPDPSFILWDLKWNKNNILVFNLFSLWGLKSFYSISDSSTQYWQRHVLTSESFMRKLCRQLLMRVITDLPSLVFLDCSDWAHSEMIRNYESLNCPSKSSQVVIYLWPVSQNCDDRILSDSLKKLNTWECVSRLSLLISRSTIPRKTQMNWNGHWRSWTLLQPSFIVSTYQKRQQWTHQICCHPRSL